MITQFCNEILGLYYSRNKKKFTKSLPFLEKVQRQKLAEIIENLKDSSYWKNLSSTDSYEELVKKIPIGTYSDYRSLIEEQKKTGNPILSADVLRYEPTSGSVEAHKWIPYTSAFLSEINLAAQVWMGDVYQRFPKIKNGTHYWSLSWLPEDLRGLTTSNDTDFFPFYQKWILGKLMAVPAEIALIKNPDAAWWATLIYLASRKNLTLTSVWSPTFWIKVTEDIEKNWTEISQSLTTGAWGRFEEELKEALGTAPRRNVTSLQLNSRDFLKNLWPRMNFISSWDSSSSKLWAEKIKTLFSHTYFQGKGLWATEGVVTIPFQNKLCLAFQSHFFEFKDLHTEEVFPSWKLQKGKDYQPILWTSSGLLRYPLQDRVRLTGFLESVPCFEFISRLQSTDMVGEKLDALWIQSLFAKNPDWKAFALIGVREPKPSYYLIGQNVSNVNIDHELSQFYHYRVAKELGQLDSAKTIEMEDIFSFLKRFGSSRLVGRNKVEVLFVIDKIVATNGRLC